MMWLFRVTQIWLCNEVSTPPLRIITRSTVSKLCNSTIITNMNTYFSAKWPNFFLDPLQRPRNRRDVQVWRLIQNTKFLQQNFLPRMQVEYVFPVTMGTSVPTSGGRDLGRPQLALALSLVQLHHYLQELLRRKCLKPFETLGTWGKGLGIENIEDEFGKKGLHEGYSGLRSTTKNKSENAEGMREKKRGN